MIFHFTIIQSGLDHLCLSHNPEIVMFILWMKCFLFIPVQSFTLIADYKRYKVEVLARCLSCLRTSTPRMVLPSCDDRTVNRANKSSVCCCQPVPSHTSPFTSLPCTPHPTPPHTHTHHTSTLSYFTQRLERAGDAWGWAAIVKLWIGGWHCESAYSTVKTFGRLW